MQIFVLLAVPVAALGAALLVPGIFNRIFMIWYRQRGGDVREKYRSINVRARPEDTMRRELFALLRMIWLLLAAGLGIGMALTYADGGGEAVEYVERPAFGEGDAVWELVAEHGGNQERIRLKVGEQSPDSDELERFFASACEAALDQVLGDNADFSNVSKDLRLITQMDQGIRIEWQISDPELISAFGELSEDIPMEGAAVQLQMKMMYGDFSRSFEIPVTLRPEYTDEEGEMLSAYINDAVAANPQAASVPLPEEYRNSTLVLHREQNTSGQKLALLVLIAALLLWISAGSRLEDAYARRNLGLEMDYPDIVSRLSVLFSAGLTVPAAWTRLAADYERELERGGVRRYGYEELRLTALELSNTGYSERLFHDFGHRCASYRYMKLADILEQSMKKGTVQLAVFMEQEAIQAFELRKMQAAKTGEEAGTKLLLPMMMMFGLVVAMVVVPAWSGMRL